MATFMVKTHSYLWISSIKGMLRVVPGSQKTMTPPIRVTGLFGAGTNGSLRISSNVTVETSLTPQSSRAVMLRWKWLSKAAGGPCWRTSGWFLGGLCRLGLLVAWTSSACSGTRSSLRGGLCCLVAWTDVACGACVIWTLSMVFTPCGPYWARSITMQIFSGCLGCRVVQLGLCPWWKVWKNSSRVLSGSWPSK